jgi:hypothetical protein
MCPTRDPCVGPGDQISFIRVGENPAPKREMITDLESNNIRGSRVTLDMGGVRDATHLSEQGNTILG